MWIFGEALEFNHGLRWRLRLCHTSFKYWQIGNLPHSFGIPFQPGRNRVQRLLASAHQEFISMPYRQMLGSLSQGAEPKYDAQELQQRLNFLEMTPE